MAQQTRLMPHALPGRLYGSFAGKAEATTVTTVAWTLHPRSLAWTLSSDRAIGWELHARSTDWTLDDDPR